MKKQLHKTLKDNRLTEKHFVNQARKLLRLPCKLLESDLKKCNPLLYRTKFAKKYINKSTTGLIVLKEADDFLKRFLKIIK